MNNPTFTAFGGIRNTLAPERLGAAVRQAGGIDQRTDLTAAVNIDLDDSGRAARRAGQTLVAPGAAHSLWSDGAGTCLFAQGGQLKRLAPDYSVSTLAAGLGGSPLRYVAVNGAVYWSDGVATGSVVDGAAQAWGLPVPAAPGVTPIAGQLAAGTYQLVQTWLAEDGQESGAGMPLRLDLAEGSGLLFSWAAPHDPRIARARFYLSTPNGEVLYLATSAPAGAGLATFSGGALATPLNTAWLDAPPAGQDLAYHRGRIWIAAGAHLFATSALGYGYCDLRDYLALDGSLVRFVVGLEHGLYAGTERAVYFLQGDELADMKISTVVDGFGVAGSALVVDGFAATRNPQLAGAQVALFASALGVCLGTETGSVTNLTLERYQSKVTRIGAAVFRAFGSDALAQYLLLMRDD